MNSSGDFLNFVTDNLSPKPGFSNLITSNLRLNFVRKVYSILSIQLLFTFLMVYISSNNKSFLTFQLSNIGIFYFFTFLSIIMMIVLSCYRNLARTVPTNYVLLSVFTFAEAYTVSTLCGLFEGKIVAMAAFLTLGITIGLTLYAMLTKKDINYFGGIVMTITSVMFCMAIIMIFVRNTGLEIVYTAAGTIFYGVYIIFDTKLIVGGGRGEINIDDYILGAMTLYLDVIVLFIKILKILAVLMGDQKKKDEKKK